MFIQGSVLHLSGEVFEEVAEEAGRDNDLGRRDQCLSVARTLFVVGLGIDAACPREAGRSVRRQDGWHPA